MVTVAGLDVPSRPEPAMKLPVLLLSALTLALAACDTGDGPPDDPADEPAQETTAPATDDATQAGSLIGVLEGDEQLEGGCAWVEPTGGPDAELGDRIELVLPGGFTVEFEPDLRIIDPQGSIVAERGDEIVVDGTPAEDMMTVCQVGPPYQVEVITGPAGS